MKINAVVNSLNISQMPISKCEFSVRAEHVLDKMGIFRVIDLFQFSDSDFYNQKNCGKQTVDEIRRKKADLYKMVKPIDPENIDAYVSLSVFHIEQMLIWMQESLNIMGHNLKWEIVAL